MPHEPYIISIPRDIHLHVKSSSQSGACVSKKRVEDHSEERGEVARQPVSNFEAPTSTRLHQAM